MVGQATTAAVEAAAKTWKASGQIIFENDKGGLQKGTLLVCFYYYWRGEQTNCCDAVLLPLDTAEAGLRADAVCVFHPA